jgi:3-ketosteroid 9alpha-monooxygenase subunit A
MYRGWYQVALSREITGDVTPAMIGDLPLVLVRTERGVTAYDAVCPHRGAHLGYGGELDDDAITCPFHGHRITLGCHTNRRFSVREFETLDLGGSVFVLLDPELENGLRSFVRSLADGYVFVPGFAMSASVAPEYVVENAFDADHFKFVHGINNRPEMRLRPTENGELAIESVFETNLPNLWQDASGDAGGVQLRFLARAFSPNLVVTELGDGAHRQVVFTAATPQPDGATLIRVSAAVPLDANGEPPPLEVIRQLFVDSKKAFEQDMEIWAHLTTDAPQNYVTGDRMVIAYREYCTRFLAAS